MDRRVKYQLKHKELGLCWLCPRKAAPGLRMCRSHHTRNVRAMRARNNFKPWRPGGRGAIPKSVKLRRAREGS